MKHSDRYSPELRERAVRLVLDPQGGHETQWAAIVSVSSKVRRRASSSAACGRRIETRNGSSRWPYPDARRSPAAGIDSPPGRGSPHPTTGSGASTTTTMRILRRTTPRASCESTPVSIPSVCRVGRREPTRPRTLRNRIRIERESAPFPRCGERRLRQATGTGGPENPSTVAARRPRTTYRWGFLSPSTRSLSARLTFS